MDPAALPPLSALDARVLGVLVEKQATVPDTYPLSLNALVAGCNQKTSRDPIMSATDREVEASVDHLRTLSLIVESSGGRVTRYAHNFGRVLQVPSAAVALLATLMLRGAQTAAELRANSERLHRFADVSAVEAYLEELSGRSAGALVVELPRQPGMRENRWAHLLCGPVAVEAPVPSQRRRWTAPDEEAVEDDGRIETLEARLAALEGEVNALKASLARLAGELAP
jgi:uncharacterized protein YceH (UPF0502 family)